MKKWISVLGFILITGLSVASYTGDLSDELKTKTIATWIQEKVNRGGYTGCRTHVLGAGLIQCDLNFPLGTNSSIVRKNVNGVAELFGQIGIFSVIYFAGYVGNLKVCEYQYDPYIRSIVKKK